MHRHSSGWEVGPRIPSLWKGLVVSWLFPGRFWVSGPLAYIRKSIQCYPTSLHVQASPHCNVIILCRHWRHIIFIDINGHRWFALNILVYGKIPTSD